MQIRRTATLGVIVLALVATACTIQASGQASPATGSALGSSLPPTNEPVAAVAAQALPAVVNVTTDLVSASGSTGQGVGTGFIVRPDGIVVTNCHVVEGATKITVFTSAKNPDRFDARVIGGDCEHDLAVLMVDGNNLPTLPLGNSADLVLGQNVVAIGYALALEGGPTVTTGIVSSLDRTVQVQDPNCDVCRNFTRTYSSVIQTDAAINHGNSGGPLLNTQGQVVGVNAQIKSDSGGNEGVGFAIPSATVKTVASQLIANGKAVHAYLGVSIDSSAANALLAGVQDNTPAAKAGLKKGDVITDVNGKSVATGDDLSRAVDAHKPGDKVSVTYKRGGSEHSVTVTLGTRPN
jgi:putative serine protease PepD